MVTARRQLALAAVFGFVVTVAVVIQFPNLLGSTDSVAAADSSATIAFASDRDGELDLWTTAVGQPAPTQISDLTGEDTHPRFSPDGTMIAWSKNGNSLSGRVWIAAADGTGATEINSIQSRFAPAWSPDGSEIAWMANSGDGDFDLFISNPDGTNARKVADTTANERDPAWTSAGIAVVRGDDVVLIDPITGADIASVTVPAARSLDAHPSSPVVAYSQGLGGGVAQLGTLDLSTGATTTVTDGTTLVGSPSWSPDGSQLVYTRRPTSTTGDFDLWTIGADGTNPQQLTSGPDDDVTPEWSPVAAIAGGEIAVSPDWGAIGHWTTASSTVGADGTCGWSADTTVDIIWDETPLASAHTDANGCFRVHVYLDPERIAGSVAGPHKVIAADSSGAGAQTAYEQVERELFLLPIVAGSAAPVAVSGCGWSDVERVEIFWLESSSTLGAVGVDAGGCLDGAVDLPRVPDGLYAVAAGPAGSSAPTGPGQSSATAVEIRGPEITLFPASGPAGTRTAISGCSWHAGEQVEAFWVPTGASLGLLDTDAGGCLRSDVSNPDSGTLPLIRIPFDAIEGVGAVRAVGQDSTLSTEALFEVVEAQLVFDPPEADPGDTVSASGCGWTGNATVRLDWQAQTPNGRFPAWLADVDPITGCFGAAGSFNFTVPDDTTSGDVIVSATGNVRGFTEALFRVVHPGRIVAPATADLGEVITIEVFDALIGETVDIVWDGQLVGTGSAGVSRDFTIDITVPVDRRVGSIDVVATGTKGLSHATTVDVRDESLVTIEQPLPLYLARPVTVSGTGFVAGSVVSMSIVNESDGSRFFAQVILGDDEQSFEKTVELRDDITPGIYRLTWGSSRGNRGAIPNVEITDVPFEITAAKTKPTPRLDGDLVTGEWNNSKTTLIPGGFVGVTSDDTRLYLLLDLLDDDTADPLGSGDGFEITVDVDGDAQIDSGLDLNFRLGADGELLTDVYTGPDRFLPRSNPFARSAVASGFGCFAVDGSLSESAGVVQCNEHRVHEIGIDLTEIMAAPGDDVRIGIRTFSSNPSTDSSTPVAFTSNFVGLGNITLASSQLPSPTPSGNLLGLGVDGFAVEVTQAIQDVDNSLPLVARKDTLVRVYPDIDDEALVRVHLYGETDDRTTLPGSPLVWVGTLEPGPARDALTSTADFRIPASWTAEGFVDFRAVVESIDGSQSATSTEQVYFREQGEYDIWVIPVNDGLPLPGNMRLPSDGEIDIQLDVMRSMFPVADLDLPVLPWSQFGLAWANQDFDNVNEVLNQVWTLLAQASARSPQSFEMPDMLYGITDGTEPADDDGSCCTIGTADAVWAGGTGRVASGAGSTDDETVMAHEVNHNLDRSSTGTFGRHVSAGSGDDEDDDHGCGAGGPYPLWPGNGLTPPNDEIGEVGVWVSEFDAERSIIDSTYADMMSYCSESGAPDSWVSPYRWRRLFSIFGPNATASSSLRSFASVTAIEPSDASIAEAHVHYVSGEVLADGSGSLDPVVTAPGTPDELAPGNASIDVRRADGTIERTSFLVEFVDGEGNQRDRVRFRFAVAAGPGDDRIALRLSDELLDVITASANPPEVAVTSPTGGESWAGNATITWTADDPDGDPLTFDVFYSPNTASTWYPVASGLVDTQLEVDVSRLPGGDGGKILVVATDGFRTATAVSDGVFTVPARPMPVRIVSPRGGVAAGNEPIRLEGALGDPTATDLGTARFVWSVDGETVAIGRRTEVILAEGSYQLRLALIVDGVQRGSATTTLVVGESSPPVIDIVPTSTTVQVGDAVEPIAVVVTDLDASPAQLTVSVNGLPAGLVAGQPECAAVGAGTVCRLMVTGVAEGPPSVGELTVVAADGTTTESASAIVVVAAEDALVRLPRSNPTSVAVEPGATGASFGIVVRTVEREPDTALGSPGVTDLAGADVTVRLEPVGPGGGVVPDRCDDRLIGDSDDQTLVTTCRFSGVDPNTYNVVAEATGDLSGRSDDVLVVYELSDRTTRGAGEVAAPDGDTIRFAFAMEFTGKGKKAKGALVVVRTDSDGSQHVVRSNSIQGLTFGSEPRGSAWTSFVGKATYATPGGEPVGNHSFIVYAEDGDPDRFWFQLDDKNGATLDVGLPGDSGRDAVPVIDGEVIVSR